MNVLHVASELAPLIKTGGLGDVTGALSKALAAQGHAVRVLVPAYRSLSRQGLARTEIVVTAPFGAQDVRVRVWSGLLPGTEVIVHALDAPEAFDRDGLYQDPARGTDYPDNLARFSLFCRAVLAAMPHLDWRPDVVHAHDWHAALVCAHLAWGEARSMPAWQGMPTVLTVHNLAYQGLFPAAQGAQTGLPSAARGQGGVGFRGQVNCLKGGLLSADRLTTVSPTYAREIQTAEFGCGLDAVLRRRAEDLTGILNGIDVDVWNPATDSHLAARYAAEDPAGKAACKRALQHELGLPERPDLLIGMVQRLVEQKGVDLLLAALAELMAVPVQLVVLGSGAASYEAQLQAAARHHPDRVAVRLGFDEALAHQIEAGADAFLMPSRFEPCGLNQMYSMRYGTVPIVRRVGGLADTVVDLTPATLDAGTATGIVFDAYTPVALVAAVARATAAFARPARWRRLMHHGMTRDFSWTQAAGAYARVYEQARTRQAVAP